MKVSELIEALKTYPVDAEVVGLWEGGWSKIQEHSLKTDRKGNEVVELDVDIYGTYQNDQ